MHLILMLLTYLIRSGATQGDSNPIWKTSFESIGLKLAKVELFESKAEGNVVHILEDLLSPGYIIHNDESSIKLTNGIVRQTLAGAVTEKGYINGVGTAARFTYIFSFDHLNKSHIVIADKQNHCLRLLDLIVKATTDYAGVCQSMGTDDGPSTSAKFTKPHLITRNQQTFFVTEPSVNTVRAVDVKNGMVTTFIASDSKLDTMTGITWSTSHNSDLLILTRNALFKVNVENDRKELMTVFEFDKTSYLDGGFSEASFGDNNRLVAIGYDLYLTSGLYGNLDRRRLRAINLAEKFVSSICLDLATSYEEEIDECLSERFALGFGLVGNNLYIGGPRNILKLTIKYDICSKLPPPIKNAVWRGSTGTGKYLCNKGYKRTVGELRQQCSFKGWYGQRPTCSRELFECLQLPPIVDRSIWNGTNKAVTFNCIHGYEIASGDQTLYCNASKQWEGEVPVCAIVKSAVCMDTNGWLGLASICLYAFLGVSTVTAVSLLALILMASILYLHKSGETHTTRGSQGRGRSAKKSKHK